MYIVFLSKSLHKAWESNNEILQSLKRVQETRLDFARIS